ncbi:hypothetical protein B0H19DRAFT_1257540 [Mycena capillaripes]|nr:hypothetical protein B0H19DRAFT_1257540 [Mycena capillaripes]
MRSEPVVDLFNEDGIFFACQSCSQAFTAQFLPVGNLSRLQIVSSSYPGGQHAYVFVIRCLTPDERLVISARHPTKKLAISSITSVNSFIIMFFAASIALASILSYTAVNSAPLTARSGEQQACSLPNGGGICIPINANGGCTNIPGVLSLVLNQDADCAAFPSADCKQNVNDVVSELFSDDSQDLTGKSFLSVQCFNDAGTVNGFTKGSKQDIEQEGVDEANGVLVPA